MWCHASTLAKCEALFRAGVLTHTWCPGSVVGRGFADVGAEEFLILPGAKLLSLQRGTVVPLADDEREYYFPVPDVDGLLMTLAGLVYREDTRGKVHLLASCESAPFRLVVVIARREVHSASGNRARELVLDALQALSGRGAGVPRETRLRAVTISS